MALLEDKKPAMVYERTCASTVTHADARRSIGDSTAMSVDAQAGMIGTDEGETLKLATFIVAIAIASTVASANAASAGDTGGEKVFCDNLCSKAADLFWEAYTTLPLKQSVGDVVADKFLLAKYREVPEDIGGKVIRFANDMYGKYGTAFLGQKEKIMGIARSNCADSCMSDDESR